MKKLMLISVLVLVVAFPSVILAGNVYSSKVTAAFDDLSSIVMRARQDGLYGPSLIFTP